VEGLLLEALAGVSIGKALTPADEMNDFVPIAGCDLRGAPAIPRQNFKIALDGHALRTDPEKRQQPWHVEPVGDLVRFAIHKNV